MLSAHHRHPVSMLSACTSVLQLTPPILGPGAPKVTWGDVRRRVRADALAAARVNGGVGRGRQHVLTHAGACWCRGSAANQRVACSDGLDGEDGAGGKTEVTAVGFEVFVVHHALTPSIQGGTLHLHAHAHAHGHKHTTWHFLIRSCFRRPLRHTHALCPMPQRVGTTPT